MGLDSCLRSSIPGGYWLAVEPEGWLLCSSRLSISVSFSDFQTLPQVQPQTLVAPGVFAQILSFVCHALPLSQSFYLAPWLFPLDSNPKDS